MSRSVLALLLLLFLCTCDRATSATEGLPDPESPVEISFQQHKVLFDLETGGRLASYTLEGKELLQTVRDEDGWQWGSTVWTSPQSAWSWPPEAAFDANPFTLKDQTASSVVLQSNIDPETGLQMTKSFAFVKGVKGAYLEADYRLFNHGQDTIYRGLWENTRLPYSGEYSVAVDSLRRDKLTRPFTKRGNYTVVRMSGEDQEKGKLFIHPGKGRATYTGNGLRFRKLWFNDAAEPVAPQQAPLELYFAPEEGFSEFEVQGPYRAIAPGEYVNLVVAWKVGKLEAKE